MEDDVVMVDLIALRIIPLDGAKELRTITKASQEDDRCVDQSWFQTSFHGDPSMLVESPSGSRMKEEAPGAHKVK